MRIRYWSSDVCSSDLFGSQPRPELDERHARSGNPLSPRPSRRCFGGHAPRAQLAGKSFAETIELNRTRIEAVAIQPLGLNRQMDMRARRVSMERQDIIVIVADRKSTRLNSSH